VLALRAPRSSRAPPRSCLPLPAISYTNQLILPWPIDGSTRLTPTNTLELIHCLSTGRSGFSLRQALKRPGSGPCSKGTFRRTARSHVSEAETERDATQRQPIRGTRRRKRVRPAGWTRSGRRVWSSLCPSAERQEVEYSSTRREAEWKRVARVRAISLASGSNRMVEAWVLIVRNRALRWGVHSMSRLHSWRNGCGKPWTDTQGPARQLRRGRQGAAA